MKAVNPLESIIRDEIHARGPMRFDRFMELALYHHEHGYYTRPPAIGSEGDFYTSVSVGALFGQLLARQARQMAQLLNEPEFWIIEQGAHDGQMALDLLSSLRATDPVFFATLRYAIVEPSPAGREAQKRKLATFGAQVRWLESLADWTGPAPCGLFLSNELIDAFPVRVIERGATDWNERCVTVDDRDVLDWCLVPIVDAALRDAMAELPLPEVETYRTEICPASRAWMRGVAGFLRRGYVLTLDYGYPASLYYAPFRMDGTLTCFHKHRSGDEVLRGPGEQDLTAHADFTALARAGAAAGLETLALVDQQRFFTGVAEDELSGAAVYPGGLLQQSRAWQTLTHPEHMGTRFHVLVQAKDAPRGLNGLRFARPGGWD
jgi:SAM-dependent MidA family methyltransferase